MENRIVALIRSGREQLVDRFAMRLLETIPQYSRLGGPSLRASIDAFLERLLELTVSDDKRPMEERIAEISRSRTDQGFSPSDFLHATLPANSRASRRS